MSIYTYSDNVRAKEINDNPFVWRCPYCKNRLAVTEVDDFWPVSNDEIMKIHEETGADYKEIHGLEDCYINLKFDTADLEVMVHYCWNCGWWRLVKNICVCAEKAQIWDIKFGCAGTLRNLDLTDIKIPLDEVKKYLITRYESI
jgi:restriction system protein